MLVPDLPFSIDKGAAVIGVGVFHSQSRSLGELHALAPPWSGRFVVRWNGTLKAQQRLRTSLSGSSKLRFSSTIG